MPVPSSMADLSTTAASNYPTGSDSPTSGDDYFRSIQAIIRSTNAKGADIASATTTDIGAATGEFVDVTGTTTITGLGTIAAGIVRTIRFTGALTLTHNATSLILPGSANITTANGDVAQFRSLGSGNWKCVGYIKADGTAVVISDNSITAAKLSQSYINDLTAVTIDPNADYAAIADGSDSGNKKKAFIRQAVLGTPTASTSGTSIEFTGIPTWVKRITLNLSGVSTNGTSALVLYIGDAGGIELTGYLGSAWSTGAGAGVNNTTAFPITNTISAATIMQGRIELTLLDSTNNTWACSGILGFSNAASVQISGGSKSLSASLDRVRLSANGVDTFDAGIVNIIYE